MSQNDENIYAETYNVETQSNEKLQALNTKSGVPSFRSKLPLNTSSVAMKKIGKYEEKILKYLSTQHLRFAKAIGIMGHLEQILEIQRQKLVLEHPNFDLKVAYAMLDRKKRGKADLNDITNLLGKVIPGKVIDASQVSLLL